MIDEQRIARVVLMVSIPMILVAVAGYFLFSNSGLGGSNDVTGDWYIPVARDGDEDDVVGFYLTLMRDDNTGELVGTGYAEYGDMVYDIRRLEDVEEAEGYTSFEVLAEGKTDNGYDEGLIVTFSDENSSPGAIEGTADGLITSGREVEGTFVGERR